MKTLTVALLVTLAAPLRAEPPQITAATAIRDNMGWRISVTVSHGDTGWEHFANSWEVTDASGHRLALRELVHPHVNEQPFTRSLSNVMLPDGIQEVFIRATCSKKGGKSDPFKLVLQR